MRKISILLLTSIATMFAYSPTAFAESGDEIVNSPVLDNYGNVDYFTPSESLGYVYPVENTEGFVYVNQLRYIEFFDCRCLSMETVYEYKVEHNGVVYTNKIVNIINDEDSTYDYKIVNSEMENK